MLISVNSMTNDKYVFLTHAFLNFYKMEINIDDRIFSLTFFAFFYINMKQETKYNMNHSKLQTSIWELSLIKVLYYVT